MNDDYVDECKCLSHKLDGKTMKMTTKAPCFLQLVENRSLQLTKTNPAIRIRVIISLIISLKQREFLKNSQTYQANSRITLSCLPLRNNQRLKIKSQMMNLMLISLMMRGRLKRRPPHLWSRAQIETLNRAMSLICLLRAISQSSLIRFLKLKVRSQKMSFR